MDDKPRTRSWPFWALIAAFLLLAMAVPVYFGLLLLAGGACWLVVEVRRDLCRRQRQGLTTHRDWQEPGG